LVQPLRGQRRQYVGNAGQQASPDNDATVPVAEPKELLGCFWPLNQRNHVRPRVERFGCQLHLVTLGCDHDD
jgi:hypothetical protein